MLDAFSAFNNQYGLCFGAKDSIRERHLCADSFDRDVYLSVPKGGLCVVLDG